MVGLERHQGPARPVVEQVIDGERGDQLGLQGAFEMLSGQPDGVAAALPVEHGEYRLVAVAAFSAPRPMKRGEEVLNSYEWVRYASLSGMRIAGGMGKLLEHFIRTHSPQEIMSYADKEWSDGDAYKKLGFELVSESDPIDFIVDTKDFKRYSIKKLRRENVTLNPEPGINNYKILRTRGNLKFLKRSSL